MSSALKVSITSVALGAGVLRGSTATGLLDLIDAGNKAAHGASLENDIARWAFDSGPVILRTLDKELAKADEPDLDQWLDRALTILDFEEPELVGFSVSVLEKAQREGSVPLGVAAIGIKDRAREVLERLGALERDEEDPGAGRFIRYQITRRGRALHAKLVSR